MAKSGRASSRKANKTKLRGTVHGPNEDARIARLSEKLLELASSNKPTVPASTMEVDEDASKPSTQSSLGQEKVKDTMDVDQPAKDLRRKKSIRKSKGKSRASIVFPGTFGRPKSKGNGRKK